MSEIENILKTGFNNRIQQLETISQNVANINTPGYLRMDGALLPETGTNQLTRVTNTSVGELNATGNHLDIAIRNQGFLVVEKGEKQYLTRLGKLHIDADGFLKHISGGFVLGERGRIQLSQSSGAAGLLKFERDGSLTQSGVEQARLFMVEPTKGLEIHPVGDGLYQPVEWLVQQVNAEIQPETLNASNTVASNEMVRMIEVSRQIQTLQKAALAYDQLMNAAINELGK